MAIPYPIPVTILTGFLGAGKTTLLNHILHGEHGLRVAVLVNDFGAVNIDSQLVMGVEGETVSLANGCICCTIRSDLLKTVIGLLKREPPPEYVLIETSGVSDPAQVASTFMLPELNPFLRVDSILTVIDAEQIRALDSQYAELAQDQVRMSDIAIVNKVDLVGETHLAALRDWIKELAPRARILHTTYAKVPLELVLGAGHYEPERLVARTTKDIHVHEQGEPLDHDHPHDHSLVFDTWSWRSEQPILVNALRPAVETLPETIYRAKGVIFLADMPEYRCVLQVVGQRMTLTVEDIWYEQTPHSQLVVIGAQDGVDAAELQARFDGTLAVNAPEADLLYLPEKVQRWLRSNS